MGLQLLFTVRFAERNPDRTYSTEYIQICIQIIAIPNSKLYCRVTGKRLNKGAGYGLEIPVITRWTGMEKLLCGYNPKSTKIWQLLKIWKTDVWNKITYEKWNICNLLSLSANQGEKYGKILIPGVKNVSANWHIR